VRVPHLTIEQGGQPVTVELMRAPSDDPDLDRLLIEIDVQTFAESTFSEFTAHALARHGGVWLLHARRRGVAFAMALRDFHDPSVALLMSMGILPGWRGFGLGEFLVDHVLRDLEADGFTQVVLHLGGRNARAMKVYREAGFVEVSREVDPSDPDDTRVRMACSLPRA
jgi:ribosomal protein S18 acetylase RimI-like enzyme